MIIDAAVYAIVPSCTLLVFNVLIIIKMFRNTMKKRTSKGDSLKDDGQEPKTHDNTQDQTNQAMRKHASRLTKLSLALSFNFMLCICPLILFLICASFGIITSITNNMVTFISTLLEILVLINHSTNFIFYLILIPSLRKELWKKVGCVQVSLPCGCVGSIIALHSTMTMTLTSITTVHFIP